MSTRKDLGLPILSNIKIHFHICSSINIQEKLEFLQDYCLVKKYGNSTVLREADIIITIFNSHLINITGISKAGGVETAVDSFCLLFAIPKEKIVGEIKIDNTTVSGRLHHQVNLSEVVKHVNDHVEGVRAIFNPHFFPGCFLRGTHGSITLFHSGAYVIVGCGGLNFKYKIHQTFKRLLQILYDHPT